MLIPNHANHRLSRRLGNHQSASLLIILCCLGAATGLADDVPQVQGTAPPGHELLAHRRGGAYFIAKGLKEDYDRLLGQMKALKADLDAGRITGQDAQRTLLDLQDQLDKLRKEIEQKRVLVSPVKIHVQTETTTFDLGPEQLLVITADNLRVEGWEGPQVKCVLEKTILAADDKPVDDHLKELKVMHRWGPARELVGRTPAEIDAEEQTFLASSKGRDMNESSRRSRRALIHRIADRYALYHDFQGKNIDTLEIEGLTHEQGNRQIIVGIKSPDGGETLGSDWQRHAALTIYVPQCRAVALRGCLVGLDVTDLHASLILSQEGSQNRDCDGTFRIRSLHGNLKVDNAPLDLIDTVRGNVTIVATMELANTGTQHQGSERTAYSPPPRIFNCRNIEGDFVAWFTRGDLKLSEISGRIDVKNEFGDTALITSAPLADKAHRLSSESGRVEVRLSPLALGPLPLQALTNCGTVRTNARQDVFEDTNVSTGQTSERVSRNWRGVKSARKRDQDPTSFFAGIERLDAVLTGADRSSGLDLISRGGTVIVTVDD